MKYFGQKSYPSLRPNIQACKSESNQIDLSLRMNPCNIFENQPELRWWIWIIQRKVDSSFEISPFINCSWWTENSNIPFVNAFIAIFYPKSFQWLYMVSNHQYSLNNVKFLLNWTLKRQNFRNGPELWVILVLVEGFLCFVVFLKKNDLLAFSLFFIWRWNRNWIKSN